MANITLETIFTQLFALVGSRMDRDPTQNAPSRVAGGQ
jgi:hypothetical protein